jgi:DNA polymerase-1
MASVPPLNPTLEVADVCVGQLVALTMVTEVGAGLATATGAIASSSWDHAVSMVTELERERRPRWVVWSNGTTQTLARAGVRIARCWDIAAVHRLLFGGWRAGADVVWARLHDLDVEGIPVDAPVNLFTHAEHDEAGGAPVGADGYLRPSWVSGGWGSTPERMAQWASVAMEVVSLQEQRLAASERPTRVAATARSESAAEVLCAELSVDGLPMDRAVAESIVARFAGPRPRSEAEADELRRRRDAQVLRHAPDAGPVDLRSPAQVKTMLARMGIDLPDTRAWRLRELRTSHPLIDVLLEWRKAERIATTYGYAWLDEHLGDDGRLRGAWTGSDGAAGRMTASAGLHNMPADMRAAVIAEPGHVFVRADLGQIEPRVLAAVSGDAALARATLEDDMYAGVARDLQVDRPTAKVAVLGAMYGQTTGQGARALRRLQAAFPVAMAYLDRADVAGQVSRDLRTYGGRLIPMGWTNVNEVTEREARARAAARGRYGRNALVQGAAAELFKVWAATVRARGASLGAQIVLCLHDELLVHVASEHSEAVAALLHQCLAEAAHRWAPDTSVRFVADVSVVQVWSDAKS